MNFIKDAKKIEFKLNNGKEHEVVKECSVFQTEYLLALESKMNDESNRLTFRRLFNLPKTEEVRPL